MSIMIAKIHNDYRYCIHKHNLQHGKVNLWADNYSRFESVYSIDAAKHIRSAISETCWRWVISIRSETFFDKITSRMIIVIYHKFLSSRTVLEIKLVVKLFQLLFITSKFRREFLLSCLVIFSSIIIN